MESVKKWLSERAVKKNGLYVHYSPPKTLGGVSGAQLRQWARGGAESRLERAVLGGQGRRLLTEAEALPLAHHLPALMAKCSALHVAVERGSLLELQELLNTSYNKRKHVMCTDEAGVGLLHKAIYYDYMDIAEWLVRNYPQIVNQRDSEGRTPLHYAALCRDEAGAAGLLEGAGAARGARDASGRTPAYYRGPARTNLALPAPTPSDMARETKNNPPGLVIKRHNIRIWCHDCDMARLQRVVWEGHGSRLLSEVCNQPIVKKFLEAVPYIMNTIREIHSSVIENDIEALMKHSGDPVPPIALSSRDPNNMTVFHKAAGLGRGGILRYIADRYPQGVNDVDNDGRTPLHYAAAVKDEQHTYNSLVTLGADESVVDNKNKTPSYYINRPQEIDKNNLKVLPEAPRTASSAYPTSWDWKLLDTEVISELNKKSRRRNFKASTENVSSNNTASNNTTSEMTENLNETMKTSSTQELIKDLPELDDSSKVTKILSEKTKKTKDNFRSNKDTEEIDESLEENSENIEKIDNQAEKTDALEEEAESNVNNDENEVNSNVVNEDDDTENNNQNHESVENIVEDETENDTPENNNGGDDIENENNQDAQIENDNEMSQPNEERSENGSNEEENEEPVHKRETETNKEQEESQENQIPIHNQNDENSSVADDPPEEKENDNSAHDAENIQEIETASEGNHHKNEMEDDDDVQVQGESQSEYSEFNLKSTAEATDSTSANIGNQTNGRNTQESLIEGIINGDVEMDSQDASISQRDGSFQGDFLIVDNEIDPEVTELINTANMEMLAALVLNGEGARLVGRQSSNSELQAFLDNVPIYMKKIHKVHAAAREGNIRDLQAALDRRKFAIARDPISANGATPLHVATIFGKTNIIKYLGGRFPETLSAVDFEGRTSLHYAAVLPDNGHYYNLLQQLGANSKDLDDNGRSAEEYYRNSSLMSLEQLLSDFGISEDAMQDMLSDQGMNHNANGHMDIPVFKTDEGRYLAKSLGDPLIKGLTEVANVKPKDPIAFLASFLNNFPEQEKPRLGTQESNLVVTREAPEVENEQPPPPQLLSIPPTNTKKPDRPIDVITVDPRPEPSPDAPEAAFSSVNRDEHGQSMLHFAAARTHTRNALFQLLQESDINLAYRDELYRTARDVSIQANVPENTIEIDRWVLHLAARDNSEKIMELLLEGYDHILDVLDEEGVPIAEVISQRGLNDMSNLLASIPAFDESRESLHAAIRRDDLSAVQEAISAEGGRTLARGKNSFGRTALHVAVLAQNEEVVAHLADKCPELLRLGDNLERTPLHYAMGIEKIESISRVLIRAGAKRVLKDLKGRQPSYYFMNKSDILRLKEEEEVY